MSTRRRRPRAGERGEHVLLGAHALGHLYDITERLPDHVGPRTHYLSAVPASCDVTVARCGWDELGRARLELAPTGVRGACEGVLIQCHRLPEVPE